MMVVTSSPKTFSAPAMATWKVFRPRGCRRPPQNQESDVGLRIPVEDGFAIHRQQRVAGLNRHHVYGNLDVLKKPQNKAVVDKDGVFIAQVYNHRIAVDDGAAPNLHFHQFFVLLDYA